MIISHIVKISTPVFVALATISVMFSLLSSPANNLYGGLTIASVILFSIFAIAIVFIIVRTNNTEIEKLSNKLHLMETKTSEMVLEKQRFEKLSEYQKAGTNAILRSFEEGLDKGITKFEFEPVPHDADTAEAANSFANISKMLEVYAVKLATLVKETSQNLQELSNGNFCNEMAISRNYPGDFATIKISIDELICSTVALVSEIQNATTQVKTYSEQVAQSSRKLTSSFEEQATTMKEIKVAVDFLTEKTHKNAKKADTANNLAEMVNAVANDGVRQMELMQVAMDEISRSSQEVAKVMSTIEGIAFRTNILALNASVEAAQAGKHSKGFGVIANEVRTLAERCAEAARNTAQMLYVSESRIHAGILKSIDTSMAFRNTTEVIMEINQTIANIAEISHEQAEEISKIQSSMELVHNRALNNELAIQNNVAVSEELSSQANILMSLVERFKLKQNKRN